jgi:hypothetical protein
MVKLLRDIAVDPEWEVSGDNALRQVVVNTHSPEVVANVSADDFVYLEEHQVSEGRIAAVRVPPGSWRRNKSSPEQVLDLTRGQAQQYLLPHRAPTQLWFDFGAGSGTARK